MTEEILDADFLIIGSGPAGVSAALPLIEAGRKVLMIDGAGDATTPWPTSRRTAAPWHQLLGENLEAVSTDADQSPKLGTPYARRITASFLRDGGISGENFLTVGAISRGGLSSIWGGFVSEFAAEDLQDWPVSVAEMRPFYKQIVERIGVSGSARDQQSDFYGRSGELEDSLPIGPAADYLYTQYRKQPESIEFSLGLARNAIITRDRAGRHACNLRQDCLWGCERGAIYDSRFDLVALMRHENFRLLDDAFAIRLQNRDGVWEVATRDQRWLRAPNVLLAAGCLATTQLAITAMPQPPERIRLQNNPVMAMPFIVPARLGKESPAQGYSLAQLGYQYTYGPENHHYVTGGLYEIGALPMWSFTKKLQLSRRGGLTLFPLLSPAILVATCYFPGSLSDNIMSWSKAGNRISASIRGGASHLLPGVADAVRRSLRGKFHKLGAWMLPGTALATPGTDVHYCGTLPMGGKGTNGTTLIGELKNASGVFVVDGSNFPSIPAKYPTLTIMANAARIGHYIARNR